MRYRIFCLVPFTAVFKLPLGVLCGEHLANREVKDPVVDDVKAKSFLPSNDEYIFFLDSSLLLQGPPAVSVCLSVNDSVENNHEAVVVWESRSAWRSTCLSATLSDTDST